MSVHTHPPMTHTHGLQDDCPRCAEYVERPTDLDAENLRRIWSGQIHTATDMKAYNALYRAAVLVQRLEEAWMWEDFDPSTMSIALFDPKPREEIDLFAVGGRR